MKTLEEKFNELTNSMINDIQNKVALSMELQIMKDLKRMGENGTLTIYQSKPTFETYEVHQEIGLKFTGEKKIYELEEKVKRLEEENKELLKVLGKIVYENKIQNLSEHLRQAKKLIKKHEK